MKAVRMWQCSPLLVVLVLGVFLVAGCAPRPPLPAPTRPAVFREWLPALRERSEHWQRFQAKIRIKALSEEKRFTFEAVLLANLPDQLRLEAFRMGQTVAVLILNHQQSSLFVPSEKMVLSAMRSEDLTNHLLGIALPLDKFGNSLSAIVPPGQLDRFEVVPRQQEWVGLAGPSLGNWSSEWQFQSEPQAVTSVKIRRGTWNCTIRYDPPVGLAVEEIPKKITFTSAQWQIEAVVQELQPLVELPETAFAGDFGREVRWVEVTPSAGDPTSQ